MILLRKLTKKSVVGFGYLTNLTVGDALLMGKHAKLIAAYYNKDRITFTDDILAELHISEEMKIKKPGKDPDKTVEAFRNYFKIYNATLTDEQRIKMWAIRRSYKSRLRKLMENVKRKSPSYLQRQNQGHPSYFLNQRL